MSFFQEFSWRAKYVVQPLLGVALICYFIYHAVEGERGLLALIDLQKQIASAKDTRDTIAQERAELEARVALLRPESLDPDLLEERARLLLNFASRDDVIVFSEAGSAVPAPASEEKERPQR